MTDFPLGRREDEKLEFKSAAALDQPHRIASEAVAMLNAEGGEIWIGISDEEGFAVRIDPVKKPESARRSLLDHLVDTIEPAPTGKEIRIEVVSQEQASALRLKVQPDPERGPYCQLRSVLRRVFVKRIADRTRPMSREEISQAFRRAPERSPDDLGRDAAKEILEERTDLQIVGKPVFWVRLEPVPGTKLPIDDPTIGRYLTDYSTTGNRPAGWNFVNFRLEPKLGTEKIYTEDEIGQKTEIHADGGIIFSTPLEELARLDREREINPLSLLEFTTALFRLAAALHKRPFKRDQRLLADAAFIRIQEWKLRPSSPGSDGMGGFSRRFDFGEGHKYQEARDLVWEQPLRFTLEEVTANPDRCGMRLVKRVYQAFGFFEDSIPREFDRETGRLVLE